MIGTQKLHTNNYTVVRSQTRHVLPYHEVLSTRLWALHQERFSGVIEMGDTEFDYPFCCVCVRWPSQKP